MKEEIAKLKQNLATKDRSLYANRNRLAFKEATLVNARRHGGREVQDLELEIGRLEEVIGQSISELSDLKGRINGLIGEFVLPKTQQQLISELDDSVPLLLFPLRIETRFIDNELWLRVFPDDIAVHTHELDLTRDELTVGVQFLIEKQLAASFIEEAEKERIEKGAWLVMTEAYGGPRSSWILRQIFDAIKNKFGNEDTSFLLIQHQLIQVLEDETLNPALKKEKIENILNIDNPVILDIKDRVNDFLASTELDTDTAIADLIRIIKEGVLNFLGFDLEILKDASWSRAPRTKIMPDRLVFVGFKDGQRMERTFPNIIPHPLILGPNPQELESELAQQGGDLIFAEDFAWIADFDQAITKGMAIRIPLETPFTNGFDRLLVIGIRVSNTPEDNKLDLEELIDNHHYSPDGMGLLPQGTPTNNTDSKGSGFSVTDPDSEDSFNIELGDPNFESVNVELEKQDGQRLADALGVSYKSLQYLANADRTDISDAKIFNKALWPATWGYYLDELLGLETDLIKKVRQFFTDHVTGRGSLPAIRIGAQPYGLLVTSSLDKWQINEQIEKGDSAFLTQLKETLTKIDGQWDELVKQVSHVDAEGDAFEHLLNMLGLHAATVEPFNRKGFNKDFWWNWFQFQDGSTTNASPGSFTTQYFQSFTAEAFNILRDLGIVDPFFSPPKVFDILFQGASTTLHYPLIDDVEKVESEVFSETEIIKEKYQVNTETGSDLPTLVVKNYIGWILENITEQLKSQTFLGEDGGKLPIPKSLLYRMLRRSLLLANYEVSMNLYESLDIVTPETRKELAFINITEERNVTRWEFMEADIKLLIPEAAVDMTVADYLRFGPGVNLPEALTFAEVKECIAKLEKFETARLERLLAEHMDLCSYRLDAWQTALFSKRMETLAKLKERSSEEQGLNNTPYIGAFGWLENLKPSGNEKPVPLTQVPESLREGDAKFVRQENSGGFIHGPSINHAVAAAVLRNAYLTHFDSEDENHFSVNLSSKRVRIAATFLEGVRNGQELGALLGYQFERNLHERFLVAEESLNQFILDFRTKFPLVADKITLDEDQDQIESKEARNVLDGYALLEATHIKEPKLVYPYGITSLVGVDLAIETAMKEEVENLFAIFDAISDLSLAEGVFQVTQGNYDRAGAMLRALSEGHVIPEPEIIQTPRSGVSVNHKINLHFDAAAPSVWETKLTPRVNIEPGLNNWLENILGHPDLIKIVVSYKLENSESEDSSTLSVAELEIRAIDLVSLVGAELGQQIQEQSINDLTELENRIDSLYRRKNREDNSDWDASGQTTIHFMSRDGFDSEDNKTLFELLPLLRALQQIISSCRPLGADDYMLPSEESSISTQNANPKCWDFDELQNRLETFVDAFKQSVDDLFDLIKDSPTNEAGGLDTEGDLSGLDFNEIRKQLTTIANYGIPNSYPMNAVFTHQLSTTTEEAVTQLKKEQLQLLEQAFSIHESSLDRYNQAEVLRTFGHIEPPDKVGQLSVEQKVEIQRNAAKLIFGDAFQLIPRFEFKNQIELEEAFKFSNEAPVEQSCLRFAQSQRVTESPGVSIADWRPLIIEEWMQGVAAVREKVDLFETISSFGEVFNTSEMNLQAIQLPLDKNAHWIAVEYPDPDPTDTETSFIPEGDFLSIVPHLPAEHSFNQVQSGLLIDEWNEIIPNKVETTGIAVHYNQPNTEPPQTILLAVSPVITGNWEWEDLIDIFEDTLQRVKKRAVEPDQILNSPYAQLLPAILTSYTPIDFNTISTNLANDITLNTQ